MTLGSALDLAIGLIFAVLVVSLTVSGVTEVISNVLKKRSRDLWAAIGNLVDPPTPNKVGDQRPKPGETRMITTNAGTPVESRTDQLYNSPFVSDFRAVARDGRTMVKKIAASDFARGMVKILGNSKKALEALDDGPNAPPLNGVIKELVAEAEANLESVRKGVEEWFDTQMTRLGELYKRWARIVGVFVAIAVVVAANVDLIFIARTLNADHVRNDATSTAITQDVKTCLKESDQEKTDDCIAKAASSIDLPIGWEDPANNLDGADGWAILLKVLGWAIAVAAASAGAPFWFDLLRRATGFRPSVRGASGSGAS